ncbi:MAG: Fic family protein [Anaerolineae bacterium]|nr:Fic family protein [Anaerolineae bacterium]
MSLAIQAKAQLEAAGHQAALSLMDDLAAQKTTLGQAELREMHRLLFAHSWPESAGRFRTENIEITGTSFLPPHWQQVPTLTYQALSSLDYRLTQVQGDAISDIVEMAAQAHYDIAAIHPFRDGNGRIARLLLNYVFRYFDLPYVVIPLEARERYLDALDAANRGDMAPFIALTFEQYERSLNQALGLT